MKAYIVMTGEGPRTVHWTRESAQAEVVFGFKELNSNGWIEAVDVASLTGLARDYFAFRGYKTPNPIQAFLFLASEVGELADRMVQAQSSDWVRNHPENKSGDPRGEIGDVLMMLTALCNALGLDPIEQMLEKFKAKGFDPEKMPVGPQE